MIGNQGLVNIDGIEQRLGDTGVFAGDQVSFLKDFRCAKGDILEISYGSRDHI